MSRDCLNEGIMRLKQLGITGDLKEWYIKKVLSENDIEHFKFYSRVPKYSHPENINPQIICGTSHVSYNRDTTWIEMLGGLKNKIYFGGEKMASIINDYSLGGKDIGKYGDKYLIHGGNNRLCIAKFMELESVKVDLHEYEFDYESFRIFNKIKELGLSVEYNKIEECVIWELSTNNLSIRIYGSWLVDKFIEYYVSLSLMPYDYFKTLWYNYCKFEHESYYNIKLESQFEDLKMQLLAYKHHLLLI
ncbi:MAG: hypothetical protein AB7S48_17145 [Bacteroidales bacterium]